MLIIPNTLEPYEGVLLGLISRFTGQILILNIRRKIGTGMFLRVKNWNFQ